MAVRTKQLAAGRRTDAVLTTIYTCPDGETCILKNLTLFNVSTTATIDVLVAIDAGSFDKTPWFEESIQPRKKIQFDTWQVVPAGNEIAIRGDVDGGCNYWLSGTELEGVAD